MNQHAAEVTRGERFQFGQNWSRFLRVVNQARVDEAVASLKTMLAVDDLRGKSFLDAGSGSGLFSLAARILGARVVSFDYDPQSVACTLELKRRYFPSDAEWRVCQGSALDSTFLESLGTFDVAYSWGVLHHTGAMWKAMELVSRNVAPGGKLFISIYNDQGLRSVLWRQVKRIYCSGAVGRYCMVAIFFPYFALSGLVVDLFRWRNPVTRYAEYHRSRGMSRVHDWVDWLGGLPFEVATPQRVCDFFAVRGLEAARVTTCGSGLGCNEFVFVKLNDVEG